MSVALSIKPFGSPYFQKLSILFAVGFPGLNRLVLFGLVSSLATSQELGQFANDFAVAQLFSFLTSIGWGALLTVRAAQDQEHKGNQAAAGISVFSALMLIVTLPVMFVLAQAGLIFSPSWTWLYVAGWSGFNLMRAKCIGANDHPPLLAVEMAILAGTVCIVGLLWNHGKPMMLAAVPFAATGLVWLAWSSASRVLTKKKQKEAILESDTFRRGIEYGLANLTSAGLFFQLPILFSQSGEVAKAGLIGVLLSMVAVMDLVPASISAHFLPISARYVLGSDYASLASHIKRQEKVLLVGLVALILAGIGVWVVLVSIGYPITSVGGANRAFAILLACYFINHLSNPAANYLQAHERSDISIKINLATFSAFWCVYLLPLPESVVPKDVLPLIALLLPISIRSAGMRWMIRRELGNRLASTSEAR